MIKITKKTAGDRLHVSENYVSNGHWLVSRSELPPRLQTIDALRTIADYVAEMPEASMLRAAQPAIDTARTWTVTRWLYELGEHSGVGRIVVAENGDRIVLADDYCKLLELGAGDTVYAADANNVVRIGAGDTARFLMPMRIDLPLSIAA